VKELSEYDFVYETKKIKKNVSASKLFKTLYCDENNSFLYESLETTGEIGRYSILGSTPLCIFEAKDNNCKIRFDENIVKEKGNPFDILNSVLKNFRHYPKIPPFSGGAVGYVSYDSIRYIEKIPNNNPEDPPLPDMYFIFPSEIVIINNENSTAEIIVFGDSKSKISERVNEIEKIIKNYNDEVVNKEDNFLKTDDKQTEFTSNFDKNEFEKIVKKAKEYIREGEIFQVVLSQRFEFEVREEPFEIYKQLRVKNPSPYMYYIKFNDLYILGSSPETLIKSENRIAISRPIAGTRRRGKDSKEDAKLEKELLSDEKELAEHIMLVDLARNDLGRVCNYGSVKVDKLMKIEKYSKVMHIVSDIRGRLRNEVDSMELFKAAFPAGTVTGSPKIRAMEMIDELEPVRRGIYAGGIGYFGFNGDVDFCIAIRTIIIKGKRGFIQAGAGIVSDSIPENEYMETLNKASALKLTISEEK